ncbi:MAG TPA: NUDIX domain-containing protein, partial [Thermoanaerobaculia bacterium]|nr:NUDIX domain-containing protein [Thermoanaerobaculia bacterium]
ERVITRYQAIAEEPRQRAVRARVMAAAQALLEASRPGDSNQAMMELGATVCTPTRPRCLLCPLSEGCRAREQGNPERYPALARSSKKVAVKLALAVVPRPDGKILLLRRDDSRRLLAGTWELPWVEGVADGERGRAGLERELGVRYGARWELQEELGKVRHGITFRAIEAQVWRGNVSGGDSVAEGREAGWFAPAELSRLAVSSLVAKAVRLATGPGGIAGQRDAS